MRRQVALAGVLTAMLALAGLSLAHQSNLRLVQRNGAVDISPGKLLIAKPELADPNFAHTVVLIVHFDDEKGAIGVILNRRTKIALSKVMPEVKGATEDAIYEGGPVETGTAQALLRSREKVEGATKVTTDVYASGSKDVIERLVKSGTKSTDFRLYAGYAGWAPEQLETEIAVGGWSVLRANAGIIFDDDPDTLWSRLQKAADTRIARGAPLKSNCPLLLLEMVPHTNALEWCVRVEYAERRFWCVLLVAIVMAGLLSRAVHSGFRLFDKYLGDALYAAMVYVLFRLTGRIARVAMWTAVTMTAIEFFQLTQMPGDMLRSRHLVIRIGARLIGTEFSVRDLLAYAVGIAGMAGVDRWKGGIRKLKPEA